MVRRVNGIELDLELWPTPDEGAFDGEKREVYRARKEAVRMYLNGCSDREIKVHTSIGSKQAYRLINERCLARHPDGQIYGWRGLIPFLRVNPYVRKRKVRVSQFGLGAAGALEAVLDTYPDLRTRFDARILRSDTKNVLTEIRQSKRHHWLWFLEQLRKLRQEIRDEWPFNTESQGYASICRYVGKVLAANPEKAARVIGGPELERKMSSGDGVKRPPLQVLQRVEMDAHKLDGRFCVMIPQVTGGWSPKIIHRIWVIVILEVVSRAVLGYHLSFRREVSKEDVLHAIKSALTPWHSRQLSYCEDGYKEGAGLPSVMGSQYVGLRWDETSVDGALAETCRHVKRVLKDVVGSELLEPKNSFSVRRSMNDRPYIETFFRYLAGKSFQRMSNTTGKDAKGLQGRKPDQIAVTSQFQYEYAEELLDVLIANYNVKPHSGIGSRSPLSHLKFWLERTPERLRHADVSEVTAMLSVRKKCLVKGGLEVGRGIYVNFSNARYSNDVLKRRHDLVGEEIWVVNHLEFDARVALGSTLEGEPLGVLCAAPPWNFSPHSLYVRSAIQSLANKGKFHLDKTVDGVTVFMNYTEAQAGKKLPVHPAYLEARRILVSATEQSIGQSMLDIAKARAEKGSESHLTDAEPLGETPCRNSPTTRALPPMRKAVTR